MMAILLTALGWLRGAATGAIKAAMAHPCRAACLALLVASAWLWWANGRKADTIADLRAEITAMKAAQDEAEAKAMAAEARYKTNAERAEHDHDIALADARAAADRYISGHRVRIPACPSGGTAPRDSAPVPEAVPADTLVAVSDGDVQACTSAVTYAVSAFQWAQTLETQP